jgi:gliding motility-associated-like protein
MFMRLLIQMYLLVCCFSAYSQVVTACSENIGFESGTFSHWQTYIGEISATGNMAPPNSVRPAVIFLKQSIPISDRHFIIPRSDAIDYYGEFSLNSPNGSDYIVQLGNDFNGRGAERISYTINVPANVEEYSIVFSYAVIFEEPGHSYDEQPKFTARVFDPKTNTSTECGSFEFVAEGSLSGFEVSKHPGRFADNINNNNPDPFPRPPAPVLFKPWSPVHINLTPYIGRTIRLEFTTNDCSRGGHFGYAYIDFNENCSIPVMGNVTCPEAESITLRTLSGFSAYRWYNATTSELLSVSDTLVLDAPLPVPGTRIAVDLIPYPGLGCVQTLYTTIGGMSMNITDPPPNCFSVDITDISLKVGNSSDLTYSYWRDEDALDELQDPRQVTVSGVYYIKGRSSSGCTLIRPVTVTIITVPPVILNEDLQATYPGTVDITRAFDPDPGMTYTYWRNKEATVELLNPDRVGRKAIYYLRSETPEGCFGITPIPVDILIPDIVVPNTFTPNNDGANDVFTILINSNVQVSYFKIFNRWGSLVYLTSDINSFWNGLKDNTEAPAGVYYWVLEGIRDAKRYLRSGYITLIR